MTLLKTGSRGADVSAMQTTLNKLGYHIDTDGIFGNGTGWAVKDFQRKQGLPADGIAGPDTLARMQQAATGGGGTAPAPTPAASTTLRKGSSGAAVRDLQALLATYGYDLGSDGVFGWGTEAAVKAFQASKGLTSDGIAGGGTLAALKPQAAPTHAAKPLPATPTGGSKMLSEADINAVAAQLQVEPACVKAVYTVESSGKGFLSNGDPKILFEGHIFWRQLKKVGIDPAPLAAANPDILYEHWTRGHYKGGVGEYDRLNRAIAINRDAALNSASWGTFQIMGFNFKACGYSNVSDYVAAMYISEGKHLEAFGGFIKSVNLVRHLQSKNWAAFAKGYNGPAYAQNKYDTKLESAYQAALNG